MLHRVIIAVVVVPLAIILVALAVANRALTPFTLDPFNPGNPALTIYWPLFVYVFLALALGLLIGSLATWLRQGQYRKTAREKTAEAARLRDTATKSESVALTQ